MKVTIDVPDELYRRVKAKTAAQGRRVRDVTIELYERWLLEEIPSDAPSAEKWLAGWFKIADDTPRRSPRRPSARKTLSRDRERLERK